MVKNPPAIQETWIPSTCSQWNLCHFFSEITNSSVFTCLLLLLLSRFSRVWLCSTSKRAAHQAPLFLGFSRQEYWSGLPFPSPMHESEKSKWSCSVCSTLSDLMDCSPPGSSIHGIFQARVLEWGAIAFFCIHMPGTQQFHYCSGSGHKLLELFLTPPFLSQLTFTFKNI